MDLCGSWMLERDVLDFYFFLSHGLLDRRGPGVSRDRGGGLQRFSALRGLIEHNHVFGDDFRALALLSVRRFPVASLQASFHIHLSALGKVLTDDFAEARPGDHIVKFGAFLFLPLRIRPHTVRGDGEVGDGLAACGGPDLWIARKIADNHGSIEIHHMNET